MRIFLFAVLLAITALPAFAQEGEVVACGAPVPADELKLGPVPNFCDIYTRQLAYAQDRGKLTEQLRERQEAFNAPRKAAREAYEKAVEARWQTPGDGND